MKCDTGSKEIEIKEGRNIEKSNREASTEEKREREETRRRVETGRE